MKSLCTVSSEHKTRVLNVFWHWLKLFATVALISFLDGKLEAKTCSESGRVLRQLAFTGSLAFCLLVTGAMVYVGMRKRFARLEFFIVYFIQGAWNLVLLGYSFYLLVTSKRNCNMLFLLEKCLIFLIVKTELQVQTLFWAPKTVALLHANCTTNLLWPFLFLSLQNSNCQHEKTTLVLGITFFTALFSLASLVISIANAFVKGVTRLKRATFFFYSITAFIAAGFIFVTHSELEKLSEQTEIGCKQTHVVMTAFSYGEPLNFVGLIFICIFTMSAWNSNSKGEDFPDIKNLKFVQEIPPFN